MLNDDGAEEKPDEYGKLDWSPKCKVCKEGQADEIMALQVRVGFSASVGQLVKLVATEDLGISEYAIRKHLAHLPPQFTEKHEAAMVAEEKAVAELEQRQATIHDIAANDDIEGALAHIAKRGLRYVDRGVVETRDTIAALKALSDHRLKKTKQRFDAAKFFASLPTDDEPQDPNAARPALAGSNGERAPGLPGQSATRATIMPRVWRSPGADRKAGAS